MFNRKNNQEFNFWPSIADTLLAIFMVFLMLWLAEKLIFLTELKDVKTGNDILTKKFEALGAECSKFEADLTARTEKIQQFESHLADKEEQLKNAVQGWQKCEGEKRRYEQDFISCEAQKAQIQREISQTAGELKQCESERAQYLRDKPPIITLKEASGFSFETGSAQLSIDFEKNLKKYIDTLAEYKRKYHVNTIEIIGHTDGGVAYGNSNLDTELENAVSNQDITRLRYGSNADLGLIRALAVAFFLQKQPELKDLKFRVYSAAQIILPGGQLATVPERQENSIRRRIELRLTHLN